MPPDFGSCPDGWTPSDIGCDPPPADCPEGTYRFGTGADCTTIDGACGAAPFADPPDGARALFVDPTATGGDGSREAPFSRIAQAVSNASSGSVILLAAGTYHEIVDVPAGVTLIGACARETRIAPAINGSPFGAAVRMEALDSGLRGVTVEPEGLAGILVRGEATLDDVIVSGADAAGVVVLGGTLTAERLAILGTTDLAATGFGRGMAVEGGGSATVSEVLIADSHGTGLAVLDAGSRVVAEALRATRNALGEAQGGRSLAVQDGAILEVSRSVVELGVGTGLLAIAGELRLADVVVRDLEGSPSGVGAKGVVFKEGARGVLARVGLRHQGIIGLAVFGASEVTTEDLYVGGAPEGGLVVVAGSSVTASRCATDGTAGAAVLANGEGTTLTITDLSVSGARSHGAAIGGGGRLQLERAALTAGTGVALYAQDPGTNLDAVDVVVEDTEARPDGTFGRGLQVQGGAIGRVARARFERNREVAVMAMGGSVLELSSVRVAETRARACAETTCVDVPGGVAVGSYQEAMVDLQGFELDGARLCGLQVAGAAALDARDGEVRNASVGACIQVPGYDITRVTSGVVYRDNGVSVNMTEHAAPAPGDPLPVLVSDPL